MPRGKRKAVKPEVVVEQVQVPVVTLKPIVDIDEDFKEAVERAISPRERLRPSIDHLKNAMKESKIIGQVLPPEFLAKVGDRIVLERWATLLKGSPWLSTGVYIVLSIDVETGHVGLYDPACHNHACTNFITGPASGAVKIALAPGVKDPFTVPRGAPEKTLLAKDTVTTVGAVKKHRGRPKGSKNRPK